MSSRFRGRSSTTCSASSSDAEKAPWTLKVPCPFCRRHLHKRRLGSDPSAYFFIYGSTTLEALWPLPISLSDAIGCAGFLLALIGLGMNTFQVRLLVRQNRLDALVRIADSSRRFAVIAIERPDLWDSLLMAEPRSGHEGFQRDRFIQLWLNHVVVVWKCWRSRMLGLDDWEACCRDIEVLLALPAVQEEWLRVRDFYPRAFQRELSKVSKGRVKPATGS